MANIPRSFRTPKADEKFLAALARGLSVQAACEASHYARRSVYEARSADPEFAAAWDDAIEQGTDRLEDVAIKRAEDGSDTLTIFLLKGRRREKFGDNQNLKVSGGLTLEGLVNASQAVASDDA